MRYIITLLLLCMSVSASQRYVAQSAGTFLGGSNCYGQTAITISTWNSTAESPGDITWVCGTITVAANGQGLTYSWSGSSGNPLVLNFDTGAIIQSTYFYGSVNNGCTGVSCGGGVNIAGQSYITVDGQNTGIIQNTANGSSLANQQSSIGMFIGKGVSTVSDHILVKNLTIQNIYINSSDETVAVPGQGTADLQLGSEVTNIELCNNTFIGAHAGIDGQLTGSTVANGPTTCTDTQAASGINIYNNSLSDHAWHMHMGGGGSVNIYNNTMTGWSNWFYPGGNPYHLDGIIANGDGGLGLSQTLYIYRNYIHGDYVAPVSGSPTGFVYCTYGSSGDGSSTSCYVFDNLFVGEGRTVDNGSAIQFGNPTVSNLLGPYYYYNNTFINFGYHFYIFGMNVAQPLTYENNIFVGGSGDLTYYIAQNQNIAFNTIIPDYNLYWGPAGYPQGNGWNIGTGPTRASTFAAWQVLNGGTCPSGGGYDCHGLFSDPKLSGSYTLQAGSPAIQSGTNLTSLCSTIPALCYDKAGNARPSTGAWDIGAYQYIYMGTLNGTMKVQGSVTIK